MGHRFSTRLRRQKRFRQKTLNNIALFFVFLIPIYPAFGSYMQSYTGAIVRGQYDRGTIIDSYDLSTGEQVVFETTPEAPVIATPQVPEISPPVPSENMQTLPVDRKQPLYISHIVARGDTLSGIAQKYTLTTATLRTINNLTSDTLSIGHKLVIPRINGVQYVVQKGDTLSVIAQKYGISNIDHILLANDMSPGSTLSIGKKLLLPNPTKDPTKKPTPPKVVKNDTPKTTPKPQEKKPSPQKESRDPQVISYGGYTLSLKVSKGCRNFAWGNCTCFVAKYKNVTWRGNAKDWLRNAKKQGVATGNDPRPGAIIVYHGPGFPPAYGHVGIVMEVNEDHMIIKDMNYRALNEVTTRRESFGNSAIIGYIYVD